MFETSQNLRCWNDVKLEVSHKLLASLPDISRHRSRDLPGITVVSPSLFSTLEGAGGQFPARMRTGRHESEAGNTSWIPVFRDDFWDGCQFVTEAAMHHCFIHLRLLKWRGASRDFTFIFWIIANNCACLIVFSVPKYLINKLNYGVLHQLPATSGHIKSKQQTFTLKTSMRVRWTFLNPRSTNLLPKSWNQLSRKIRSVAKQTILLW